VCPTTSSPEGWADTAGRPETLVAVYHYDVRSRELGQLRECARSIAQALASLPAVEAVCLFGSVARGNLHEASDIDLLVVSSDNELSPAKLHRMLPNELRHVKLSLAYYTLDEVRKILATGSPFGVHLLREARILYDRDGILHSLLRGHSSGAEISVKKELDARLAQLTVYDDLAIFRGNFLFALSHLYAVAKSIVILALVVAGTPEFDREAAFARFVDRYPEMASEVDTISRLRPFYMLVTHDQPLEQPPFSHHGAEHEVHVAVSAIRRLAGVQE
jgi:predicted nucleotidyltransferase